MPVRQFIDQFGAGPFLLTRAPGRVNLMGDHTDYNGGFVLPMAIDRHVRIAWRATDNRTVELLSLDFRQKHTFTLDQIRKNSEQPWANYFMGVADVLQKEGHTLRGMQVAIKGNIPIGAGLSSSAALEVASAMAICAASDLKINRQKLAILCRRAENRFVGVNCGIMDQFAVLLCRKNSALVIDCTSLDHRTVPLDDSRARVIVCNTGVQRDLRHTPYNQRRHECAQAFNILKQHLNEIKTWRGILPHALNTYQTVLPEPLRRRARHVVTENIRVRHAVKCLEQNNLIGFGAVMDASHESLRNDFEVSCRELDILVELAQNHQGTYGARMTGAGFGGCIVALVRPDAAEDFSESVAKRYTEQTGRTADIHAFHPSEGATLEKRESP